MGPQAVNSTRRQWMGAAAALCWPALAIEASAARAQRWRIAEIQSISHASLDADSKGFAAGLASAGIREGQHVEITRMDAGGDSARLRAMAQQLVQAPYDVIHTLATDASQAVVRAGPRAAVVFSSVTDPIFAQLVPSSSAPGRSSGTLVTGVSDMWPVDMQFSTYASMVPMARTWGTIYNPAESNAVIHVARMHAAAKRLGVQLLESKLRNVSELESVAHALLAKVQALSMAADNTTLARMEMLADLCDSLRIPLFAGDLASVPRGAVAAYGLDYFLVGYAAGRKAALVLKGVQVGDIPWGPMEKFSFTLNHKAALAQGVELTRELRARASKIWFDDVGDAPELALTGRHLHGRSVP